jgi:hypothetical protein
VGFPKVLYVGWAAPGEAVRVNGAAVTVGPRGFWWVKEPLTAGLNTFTFTATNATGGVTTIVKHVTYKPEFTRTMFSWWDHHCDHR